MAKPKEESSTEPVNESTEPRLFHVGGGVYIEVAPGDPIPVKER